MKMKRSVPLPDVEKINIAGVWAALPYTRHPSWSPQLNCKLEMRVANKSNTEMHWKIAIGTFVFFFKAHTLSLQEIQFWSQTHNFPPIFAIWMSVSKNVKRFDEKIYAASIDMLPINENEKKSPTLSQKKTKWLWNLFSPYIYKLNKQQRKFWINRPDDIFNSISFAIKKRQ